MKTAFVGLGVMGFPMARHLFAAGHEVRVFNRSPGKARRFVAEVGLTPVAYRRLARLRSVLRLYARGSRGWAAIAAATGFSDQAHLVRDCRAFTGLTPTEWAASQMPGAGFLQDGAVTTG